MSSVVLLGLQEEICICSNLWKIVKNTAQWFVMKFTSVITHVPIEHYTDKNI